MRPSSSAPVRLIAVDLDGTLLNRQGSPHDADVRALIEARTRGIPLTIVTGRLYSGTRPSAQTLGIVGPVACIDGSQIIDPTTDNVLVHCGISGKQAEQLRSLLAPFRTAAFVFASDQIVHDELGDGFAPYVSLWSSRMTRLTGSVFSDRVWSTPAGLSAVIVLDARETVLEIGKVLQRDLGRDVQFAMFPAGAQKAVWGMVIRAAGASKGHALRYLADHHRVTLDEVLAVGDWLNDVSMLSIAGRAYAMGHAPQEVVEVCTHHLKEDHLTGGGIARALAESLDVTVPRDSTE